ncbi:MAG: signal peptidase II [Actinomycetia bacterium]|nr:signal peptidase II [Actinomycetes bacterium]
MNESEPPSQYADVRVGSATDAKAPVSVAKRSLAARPAHWVALAAVSLSGIVADQLTKAIIVRELELGEAIHLVGPLYLHHVQNSGIAFGLFQNATWAVTILTVVAVVWMVTYFTRAGARHPLLPVALGFLIGGSVSNLVDRFRLGRVTDFIDPQHWPAFNLADVFITVGVLLLLVTIVAVEHRPRLQRG